jgi:AcrR family transcriptional regulator
MARASAAQTSAAQTREPAIALPTRRAPKQGRSKALVDALLEAAARILVRDGWGALTTNRVAAEAGVSVGSLYQYYPHKDAIVAALVERLGDDMLCSLLHVGHGLRGRSVEEAVVTIVRAALEATRRDAALHRALARELPHLGALEVYERMNRRLADVLAEWIAAEPRLAVEDPSLTAFAIVTTLDALTDQALFFRPELLDSARFTVLLERVVASLLTPIAPAGAKAQKKARRKSSVR